MRPSEIRSCGPVSLKKPVSPSVTARTLLGSTGGAGTCAAGCPDALTHAGGALAEGATSGGGHACATTATSLSSTPLPPAAGSAGSNTGWVSVGSSSDGSISIDGALPTGGGV